MSRPWLRLSPGDVQVLAGPVRVLDEHFLRSGAPGPDALRSDVPGGCAQHVHGRDEVARSAPEVERVRDSTHLPIASRRPASAGETQSRMSSEEDDGVGTAVRAESGQEGSFTLRASDDVLVRLVTRCGHEGRALPSPFRCPDGRPLRKSQATNSSASGGLPRRHKPGDGLPLKPGLSEVACRARSSAFPQVSPAIPLRTKRRRCRNTSTGRRSVMARVLLAPFRSRPVDHVGPFRAPGVT